MNIQDFVKDKDVAAQEIVRLLADAAEKEALARKIGQAYTDMYSGFTVGDKIMIKVYKWSTPGHFFIKSVSFDDKSTLPGFARLQCAPATKNWKEINGRSHLWANEDWQVVSKL